MYIFNEFGWRLDDEEEEAASAETPPTIVVQLEGQLDDSSLVFRNGGLFSWKLLVCHGLDTVRLD